MVTTIAKAVATKSGKGRFSLAVFAFTTLVAGIFATRKEKTNYERAIAPQVPVLSLLVGVLSEG